MNRRRWVLFGCLIFVVAVALLLRVGGEGPRYKGRPLSHWMGVYADNGSGSHTAEEIDEAINAIRRIGTNGLPWLLRWSEYQPKPGRLDTLIDKLPMRIQESSLVRSLSLMRDRQSERANAATQCLLLLGVREAPAVQAIQTLNGLSTAKGFSLESNGVAHKED